MGAPHSSTRRLFAKVGRAGSGFVAGFVATLIFHQAVLAVLHLVGLTEHTPFVMERLPPLGVPAVVSLGFWGGLWGIVLVYASVRRGKIDYWLFAAIFGAVAPTLANWFISAPLHGRPLGNGWQGANMLTSVLVNTAWGLGTALCLRLLLRSKLDLRKKDHGDTAADQPTRSSGASREGEGGGERGRFRHPGADR
jgi:hypothetical protein